MSALSKVRGQGNAVPILVVAMIAASLILPVMLVRYTALAVIVQALVLFGAWGLLRGKRTGDVDLLPAFLVTVLPLTVFMRGIDLDKFIPVYVFDTTDKMPAMIMALCLAVLVAAWALSRRGEQTDHEGRPGTMLALFLVYVLVSLLSIRAAPPNIAGVAEGVNIPDTWRETIPTILSAPLFFCAGFHLIRGDKETALLVKALMVCAVVATLSASVEFIDRNLYYRMISSFASKPESAAFDPWSFKQMNSIIGWSTTFGGVVLLSLPGCWVLWTRARSVVLRVIYLSAGVLMVCGILLTNVRGVAVAATAEVIVLLVLTRERKTRLSLVIASLLLMSVSFGALLALLPRFQQDNLAIRFREEGTLSTYRRLEIIELNLREVLPGALWLGVGPGRFPLFNPLVEFRPDGYTAHNFLLQSLIETGVLGFAAFVGLILLSLRPILSVRNASDTALWQTALTASAVGILILGLSITVFNVRSYPIVGLFWLQRGAAWRLK